MKYTNTRIKRPNTNMIAFYFFPHPMYFTSSFFLPLPPYCPTPDPVLQGKRFSLPPPPCLPLPTTEYTRREFFIQIVRRVRGFPPSPTLVEPR